MGAKRNASSNRWDEMLRNPITGIVGGCARATNGHAAAPPRSVMNSRRLMGLPLARRHHLTTLG
jgi:hypothetical protein